MKLYLVVFLAGLVVHCQADNINEVFDSVVKATIEEGKDKFDPIGIPDKRNVFKRRLGFITISGFTSIENVTVYGLSTLMRSGDCHLVEREDGDGHNIILSMAIKQLRFNGRLRATLGGLRPDRLFQGSYENLGMDIVIHYSYEAKTRLVKLNLHSLEKMTFKISGDFKIFNKIANFLTTAFLKLFKTTMKDVTEKAVTKILGKVLASDKLLEFLAL
ncbi:Mite allergen Der p 7 [Halotydeus destructor]|nr:Mite allergen Der p 7 [Halotydeus destructor]